MPQPSTPPLLSPTCKWHATTETLCILSPRPFMRACMWTQPMQQSEKHAAPPMLAFNASRVHVERPHHRGPAWRGGMRAAATCDMQASRSRAQRERRLLRDDRQRLCSVLCGFLCGQLLVHACGMTCPCLRVCFSPADCIVRLEAPVQRRCRCSISRLGMGSQRLCTV